MAFPSFPQDFPDLGEEYDTYNYRTLGPEVGEVVVRESYYEEQKLAQPWEVDAYRHFTQMHDGVQIRRAMSQGLWHWILVDGGRILDEIPVESFYDLYGEELGLENMDITNESESSTEEEMVIIQ